MWPRDLITLATIAITVATASIDLDFADYEGLTDSDGKLHDGARSKREVRCYCNQPQCVSQGYMCRGPGCFTELPAQNSNPFMLRLENNPYSGCLEVNIDEGSCPVGFLCCAQDLCNHIDSPAMKNRLNKTLRVLAGDQKAYLGPAQPTGHMAHPSDRWFKLATIAVPICGLIVLLILASLAIRLLQPLPIQSDKLAPHRMLDMTAPPLLGPSSKVPLV